MMKNFIRNFLISSFVAFFVTYELFDARALFFPAWLVALTVCLLFDVFSIPEKQNTDALNERLPSTTKPPPDVPACSPPRDAFDDLADYNAQLATEKADPETFRAFKKRVAQYRKHVPPDEVIYEWYINTLIIQANATRGAK